MGREQVLLGQEVPLNAGTQNPTPGCRVSYSKAKMLLRSGAGCFTNIPSLHQHRIEPRNLKKKKKGDPSQPSAGSRLDRSCGAPWGRGSDPRTACSRQASIPL